MTNQALTRDELKRECYQLIDAIADHRYGIALQSCTNAIQSCNGLI